MNLEPPQSEQRHKDATDIAPPPPQNLLRFSNGEYHRTAVRHRSAATTVLLFDRTNVSRLEASATFRDQVDAHSWAQAVAHQNPQVTVALLNKYGECVMMLNTPAHMHVSQWSWAESLWRGAKPIPRHKSEPPQPELSLGLPSSQVPQQPGGEQQADTGGPF
jgi:hypothetical protein